MATAAARGHLAVVQALTEAGADVRTGNADGDSVVAIACWEDHADIVRFLGGFGQGVQLDARNLDGITPLEVACMRGNLRSVAVLHALRVNMDEVNEHGDTPFLIACWEVHAPQPRRAVASLDISYNPFSRPEPFYRISRRPQGHLDVVKFLFRVGGSAVANRMNANGDTPLAVASWEGHLHVVSFLTAVGVELQVKNADGLTAYDVAVMRQHPLIVKFFKDQVLVFPLDFFLTD